MSDKKKVKSEKEIKSEKIKENHTIFLTTIKYITPEKNTVVDKVIDVYKYEVKKISVINVEEYLKYVHKLYIILTNEEMPNIRLLNYNKFKQQYTNLPVSKHELENLIVETIGLFIYPTQIINSDNIINWLSTLSDVEYTEFLQIFDYTYVNKLIIDKYEDSKCDLKTIIKTDIVYSDYHEICSCEFVGKMLNELRIHPKFVNLRNDNQIKKLTI
jgi:hypothetical protein